MSRFMAMVAFLLVLSAIPSVAKERVNRNQLSQLCENQYNALTKAMDGCMAEYAEYVQQAAQDRAQRRAQDLCVKLHPDQFPHGIPQHPSICEFHKPLGWSEKDYEDEVTKCKHSEKYVTAVEAYRKEFILFKQCTSEVFEPPTPDDYGEAQQSEGGRTRILACRDIIRAVDSGTRSSLQSSFFGLQELGPIMPASHCTKFLRGKDMYCELRANYANLCDSNICGAGDLYSPAKRCEPSSEFHVNRPIRENIRRVNQDSGPTRNASSGQKDQKASAKSNLDRFDLGPTFVSPDSSSAVSRTARSAGSSKTMQAKTTGTSDAKTPKTSGAPMAAGGGIQGTVKTPGVSDAAKPSMSQKTLSAPIVGGTKDTVKEQVGGAGGTVRVEPK